MPVVTLTCLREDQHDPASGAVYPLYCGFSSAKILLSVAAAPSYTVTTPHHDIAGKVTKKPAEDWQRPLSDGRVTNIALVFSDPSKIMPNPVLLAEDVTQAGLVSVAPKTTPNGQPTGLFEVQLTVASPAALWILDGQHRINGLAKSSRADAPLPFVLLLREGANSYSPSQFAEIFAQVTTEAEDLRPEHREWLSYAFELGHYSPARAGATAYTQAFACAVDLCSKAPTAGDPRPFYNGVRFNPFPKQLPAASSGGFGRTCQDLASLIRSSYFGQPAVGPHLPPTSLAQELSQAYVALHSKVVNPQASVFFGDSAHEMQVVQDGFLKGVLAYLRTHGTPGPGRQASSWADLLDKLQFATTPWDFTPWVRSLSGPAQSDSSRISGGVFTQVFKDAQLPPPTVQGGTSPTIVDILKGNGGVITVVASALTPKGSPSKSGQSKLAFPLTGNGSVNLTAGQEHLKAWSSSPNVARTSLQVASGAGGVPTRLARAQLTTSVVKPPFSLYVHSHLFGGIEQVLDLSVT